MNLNTPIDKMSFVQIESAKMVRRANLQMFQCNFHDAISVFSEAISIDPECLLAYQGRAFCNMMLIDEIPTEDHHAHISHIISDMKATLSLTNILESHLC